MSSKVLETTCKIYKGQGNYLNKMEKILSGEGWKDIKGIIIIIIIIIIISCCCSLIRFVF